jgi:hypothetical protein
MVFAEKRVPSIAEFTPQWEEKRQEGNPPVTSRRDLMVRENP